jgi:hypothetical protein
MESAAADMDRARLEIISFNMHGFNQGCVVIDDIIQDSHPDVFLLQEHWLTPANLCKFNHFSDYFTFGCSAMSKTVESGPLNGRPFGGVIALIKNDIRSLCEVIHCSDRYVILRISNYVIINIYLPCIGTADRLLICEDLFIDIWSWRERYANCACIIAGDFNVDLDSSDNVSRLINDLCTEHSLIRCDKLFKSCKQITYSNTALNQQSTIDYMLISSPSDVIDFEVLDPDINFSDHMPLSLNIYIIDSNKQDVSSRRAARTPPVHSQLRWDHGDIVSFYNHTGKLLQPIVTDLNDIDIDKIQYNASTYQPIVDRLYENIVAALNVSANLFIPQYRKNFFKFWWNQELSLLKEASVESNRIWKDAGKPRSGPIFDKRQSCRLQYRKRLREEQKLSVTSYSNDLHDALLKKNNTTFWKVWKSKFECINKSMQVDGCTDDVAICDKFSQHFSDSYSPSTMERSNELHRDFSRLRETYCGAPFLTDHLFDVELVSKIIMKLKRGKASDLDNLSAEHVIYSHPLLSVALTKLFNVMLLAAYVPDAFGHSYTVPIPKIDHCSKPMTCSDFRGIAISPIISKIFEHCILERFDSFLGSNDNQFGFKKGVGCNHAIFTVRKIVDRIISGGSTANLCAVDLSKAFDKVNHNALFIKLMKRNLPTKLLDILVYWFSKCWSCVKWVTTFSSFYKLEFGVRQGSVLSPTLFAIYLDELANYRRNGLHTFVILYADDILLVAQSISELQRLLSACEVELRWLDMNINFKKTCCVRVGPRCNVECLNITTADGHVLPWVDEVKYLGIVILRSRVFKCSFDQAKRAFYRSLNAIFGRVGRLASEEVLLQLVNSKCLPVLLYGTEACPLNKSDNNSFDFIMNRFLMKLFGTINRDIIATCRTYFNIQLPSVQIKSRTAKFAAKYRLTENAFCRIFS